MPAGLQTHRSRREQDLACLLAEGGDAIEERRVVEWLSRQSIDAARLAFCFSGGCSHSVCCAGAPQRAPRATTDQAAPTSSSTRRGSRFVQHETAQASRLDAWVLEQLPTASRVAEGDGDLGSDSLSCQRRRRAHRGQARVRAHQDIRASPPAPYDRCQGPRCRLGVPAGTMPLQKSARSHARFGIGAAYRRRR